MAHWLASILAFQSLFVFFPSLPEEWPSISLWLAQTFIQHVRALLINKDLCECQNVSVKFPCAFFICVFHSETSSFFGRVSPFYSYFCIIHTSLFSFLAVSLVWIFNLLIILTSHFCLVNLDLFSSLLRCKYCRSFWYHFRSIVWLTKGHKQTI